MKIMDLVHQTASAEYLYEEPFVQSILLSSEAMPRLVGAGLGMSGEVGEFNEIVKKHLFQGRPLDRDKAKKELGDIYWYFALACMALDTTPEEIEELVSAKLLARYSSGKFTVEESENRNLNDN